MSRIGKQPIAVPAGVKVDLNGQHITITGKKGTLERDIITEIEAHVEDNGISVPNPL
ncbi:probable 50S ribosomal protein L6 [Desulfotalea psychrophila LSv54]|uniref:Probable 50S ribosomal protein L6 n=1 Tax=Desulfotalea psychrophila (strain LSv54 / DSM 12343) TaxID=177439 RepID=Q6AP56_DESPS|nr:50S ribosomal protein L6 [Desulfotalea psychrophila]CAG35868.1 probable 50S ribosomal protein L6 [Desulfotalea psychrophila LSv54]